MPAQRAAPDTAPEHLFSILVGTCARRVQEDGREDAAYFESLSAFVSKVRGEHFGWEQARDMTFKDIAKNVEAYHNMLTRCVHPCACLRQHSVGCALRGLPEGASAEWQRVSLDSADGAGLRHAQAL